MGIGRSTSTEARDLRFYLHPLKLTYSHCKTVSIAEYLGYILEPGENGDTRPNKNSLNVTDSPAISATFENGSASLEIRGMYRGNPVLGKQGATSFIGGPVMISFLGTVDGNRSDALIASSNDTPVWNETFGVFEG